MELSEEENKAIEDSKELINDLEKHKDKDFIGRLYYKNKPIEDTLMLLLNIIERYQEEIDTWKETENDYEHELARKDEEIEKQQKEIEELKEKNKTLETLLQGNLYEMYLYYKELASRYQANSISKEKIREKIKNIEAIYKKEMKPYQTEYGLNLSLLSKKEKEEVINKRNGLLTQKITLEELLEGNENE